MKKTERGDGVAKISPSRYQKMIKKIVKTGSSTGRFFRSVMFGDESEVLSANESRPQSELVDKKLRERLDLATPPPTQIGGWSPGLTRSIPPTATRQIGEHGNHANTS